MLLRLPAVSAKTGRAQDAALEIRARLRRRAELALPGGRVGVVLGDEAPEPNVELICAARRRGAPPLAGFACLAATPLRRATPLHALLGPLFRPEGVFHHVGSRLCLQRVRGWREEVWLREGSGRVVEAPFAGRLVVAFSTAGGLGFAPVVGATLASFAPAAAAFLAGCVAPWETVRAGAAALAAVATIACLLVERGAERHFLSDDAREFVLDEVAGVALALVLVPTGGWGVWLAFALFRVFDVLKPGVKWIERRKWRGTVVWDDLLAGLYAGLCTAGLLLFVR
jgi:phosphatidylglycerophosphatase A